MNRRRTKAEIRLNVYDLHDVNQYTYWAGVGVFHSGVEIHGVEYTFGGHPFSSTGVFEVEPKHAPGARFRESVVLGTTELSHYEIQREVHKLKAPFAGNSYNILTRNCNHFSDELCKHLLGSGIPGWTNRLAWIGAQPWVQCMLPQSLGLQVPTADGGVGTATVTEERQPFVAFSGTGNTLSSSGGGATMAIPAGESMEETEQERRERAANAAMKRLLAQQKDDN